MTMTKMTNRDALLIEVLVELKPSAKKRWLEELRSGEYRQATGSHLCVASGGHSRYSCLGVLYDTEFDGDWYRIPDSKPTVWVSSEWSSWLLKKLEGPHLLTSGQARSVGLSSTTQQKLATMNDCGMSFEQIADWIEANL